MAKTSRKRARAFIDFLLLDTKSCPLIVLEAKSEDRNPLVGKEQARKYAKSQNCRFVILSNGNLHYFWDLERGNPMSSHRSKVERHRLQIEQECVWPDGYNDTTKWGKEDGNFAHCLSLVARINGVLTSPPSSAFLHLLISN